MKRFSKKEQAFIYYKARGLENPDCIMKAGYKASSRIQASKYAYDLLQKQEILQAIENEKTGILDQATVTDEFVVGNVKDIALNGKKESNRLAALIWLGEVRGLVTKKIDLTGKIVWTQAEQEELTHFRGQGLLVSNIN